MKLQTLDLLDINKTEKEFEYIYGVSAKKLFGKAIFKFVFRSKLPHFWWKEIQKMMIHKGIFFEDLTKGVPSDISIGTIEYADLSSDDITRFGKEPTLWKSSLESAIEKQSKLEAEYNKVHGQPDLKGTGFISDYDPQKQW